MHTKQFAVITGATKGIGLAVVEKISSAGMSVIFCARSAADVMSLEKLLKEAFPQQIFVGVVADVSTETGRQALKEAVQQTTNQIHLLLNNAGVFLPGGILTEAPGTLEKLTETNVYSAYHLTRSLIPFMLPHREGHIFNVCSTASVTAYVNGGSYCITKFALLGMSKVLREELKTYDIKVTALLPGATYTASWQGSDLPETRFMKASDVADMLWACYQLSPSAVVEELLMRPVQGDLV
jgi:short-subunit dehydrogenase